MSHIHYLQSPETREGAGTCCICGSTLIKDYRSDVTGRRVTEEERAALERVEASYQQTMQCTGCGNLCWRRNAVLGNDGEGQCKRCGGTDLLHRPTDILRHDAAPRRSGGAYIRVWQCPDPACPGLAGAPA